MNIFKVLGGVALGVAAIAAAPIIAPAMAIGAAGSAIAAAGAGVAAAAGAAGAAAAAGAAGAAAAAGAAGAAAAAGVAGAAAAAGAAGTAAAAGIAGAAAAAGAAGTAAMAGVAGAATAAGAGITAAAASAGVVEIASVVGGAVVVSNVANKISNDKDKEAIRNKYESKMAEMAIKAQKLAELISKIESKLKDNSEREKFVVALYAVALSAAHCNGGFADEEKLYIEEFILGESGAMVAENLKSKVKELYNNPPNFNTAMEYVKIIDVEYWDSFEGIIEHVISVDGSIDDTEIAFKESWYRFRKSY